MCLGRLGRFEDALAEAKRVVATMPTWGRGAARLGAAHEALGQYSEAVSAYEKARWLATSHDNDPQGLKEYDAALAQARWRASSGFMDDLALAQGQGPKGALGRGERFPSKGPDAAPPP
jgi:tetratricopeptide (TPR) repeat protein